METALLIDQKFSLVCDEIVSPVDFNVKQEYQLLFYSF
jgi:hypothetical protein